MSAVVSAAAMGAMLLKSAEPAAAYLVDAQGRTIGGPAPVKSSRLVGDQVEVDVEVTARSGAFDATLRLYAAAGPIVGFDVPMVQPGDILRPPRFGFVTV